MHNTGIYSFLMKAYGKSTLYYKLYLLLYPYDTYFMLLTNMFPNLIEFINQNIIEKYHYKNADVKL